MPLKRFADFRDELRDQIWPSGYPENNLASIKAYFIGAMMDLQKWVPCLKVQNTSVFQFCSTYFNTGKTFVDLPNGVIGRVWTIANDNYKTRVDYHGKEMRDLDNWSKNILQYTIPLNSGLPKLPLGDRHAEKVTDAAGGRSHTGVWAIYRRRLYVAPWIQSNETLIIEWDGIKADWKDDDLVNDDVWTEREREAIKQFVRSSYESDFGDFALSRSYEGRYAEKLAALMHDCREKTTRRHDQGEDVHDYTPTDLKAEKIPEEVAALFQFALIGNYGSDDANELAVSHLVKGWSPRAIITAGSNNYTPADTDSQIDARIGQYYSDYIFPYNGVYGVGGSASRFYPALGAKDLTGGNFAAFLEYFVLPNNGRYYDFFLFSGLVHVMVLDSGLDDTGALVESAGNTYTSLQGQWLQAKLAMSTAKFKIVVCSHPPYSSFAEQFTDLRWPFKVWGADMVISSYWSAYERLSIDGLPYLINGAGGAALLESAVIDIDANSQAISVEKHGALRLTAGAGSLLTEFIDVDGVVIDSFSITK